MNKPHDNTLDYQKLAEHMLQAWQDQWRQFAAGTSPTPVNTPPEKPPTEKLAAEQTGAEQNPFGAVYSEWLNNWSQAVAPWAAATTAPADTPAPAPAAPTSAAKDNTAPPAFFTASAFSPSAKGNDDAPPSTPTPTSTPTPAPAPSLPTYLDQRPEPEPTAAEQQPEPITPGVATIAVTPSAPAMPAPAAAAPNARDVLLAELARRVEFLHDRVVSLETELERLRVSRSRSF